MSDGQNYLYNGISEKKTYHGSLSRGLKEVRGMQSMSVALNVRSFDGGNELRLLG